MSPIVIHFALLESEPKIGTMLLIFGALAGCGLFAGERWGWRASSISAPIAVAALIFASQSDLAYHGIVHSRSTGLDPLTVFTYSLAGGFSLSMAATATGIWLHRRSPKRSDG
jgi:hypothetical protein